MTSTRPATPADAALIAETLRICFASYEQWAGKAVRLTDDLREESLASRLASPDAWALIAFDGEEVAGHVAIAERSPSPGAAPPPHHAKLWQIFVRPRWQGTGLATDLMHAAEREAIDRGYTRMALWTPRDHVRARRFYEREGWTPSGREQEATPLGFAVTEYVRALDAT